jgi:hypothetical protein
MGNMNKMPPVVVVYKTSNRKNAKLKLEVYHNVRVDDILDTNKRKPIIPYESEILEIGIGRGFEETYKKKYKL